MTKNETQKNNFSTADAKKVENATQKAKEILTEVPDSETLSKWVTNDLSAAIAFLNIIRSDDALLKMVIDHIAKANAKPKIN